MAPKLNLLPEDARALLNKVPALNFITLGSVVRAERAEAQGIAPVGVHRFAVRMKIQVIHNNKLELATRAVY